MHACANILYIPIVVMPSADNIEEALYPPQLSQKSSKSLYLAYNADWPGHYDGTKKLTQEDIGDEITKSFY